MPIYGTFAMHVQTQRRTVEIANDETGYNEQPDITSKFSAKVWSRI